MRCSVCSTVNPENAKFCFNCGAALAVACPSCGTPAQQGAKFCFNCGYSLQTPSAPAPAQTVSPVQRYMPADLRAKMENVRANRTMEGDRRTVTILFCDVRGSTALAERLDPEEWAEIMNGAFERLISPVYRYEGTVARLMGDAILAFFGAPIAHEDDPRRAVLAGLDILEGIRAYRLQLDPTVAAVFDVRIGVNTGPVVVGEIGSDLAVEYTAMGDAVNLASRMEQTAQPGTIQIASGTYRLVQDLFEVEPLGGIEVKGKSEPVQTYRVLSERQEAIPKRGIEGLHSPLVGREPEAAALNAALDALRGGRGSILSLTGEAGLGKSRLLAETHARHDGGEIRWLEGRAFSYERSVPFTPFISMLSRFFEIDKMRGDVARYARLKERVSDCLPDRGMELAPPIAAMLGIAVPGLDGEQIRHLEPPQLRGAIFGAVTSLFAALASQRPLVLVFEDLHWADDTSLELLQALLPLAESAPAMVIALFRPHRDEPSWGFHEAASRDFPHRYTEIALQPLDEHAAEALVGNLLWIEDLPASVRALILQKSEGNPFFVEEVIRSLLDSGLVVRDGEHWRATREIADVRVPDTLAGVITARLDRVPDEPRRVMQAASVVGRHFEHVVLADVHDDPLTIPPALSDLQQRELILERQRLPDRLYSFKHGLTQETAYNSILLSKRRGLHRRVAECLERSSPDRVAEVARNFLEAREDARALPYVVEAGERARRTGALDTAIDWFRQAIRIGPMVEDADLVRRAYEGLGKSLELKGDVTGVMETYTAMYDVGESRGDIPIMVSALNKRAFVRAMMLGQMPEAVAELDEAERLGRQARDSRGLVEMAVLRCQTCLPAAKFSAAMESLGSSVDVARETGMKEELAEGLIHSANTLSYMTRFDDAWTAAQEGMALAQELDDLLKQAELFGGPYVFEFLRRGDFESALRFGRKGLDLARQIGSVVYQAIAATILIAVEGAMGEYEAAITHANESLRFWEMLGPYGVYFSPAVRAGWGTAAAGISREYFDRTFSQHIGAIGEQETHAGATAWAELGFLALRTGDLNRAHELFERGLTIPTSFWLMERPRLLIGSAMVELSRGNLKAASERIEQARSYAEERSMHHVEPMIAFALAQIRFASGDPVGALEQFEHAADLAGSMRMRPLVVEVLDGAITALGHLGKDGEAERYRIRLREAVEDIRGQITDPEMLQSFDRAHGVPVHG